MQVETLLSKAGVYDDVNEHELDEELRTGERLLALRDTELRHR
jgi:hypothetical protein